MAPAARLIGYYARSSTRTAGWARRENDGLQQSIQELFDKFQQPEINRIVIGSLVREAEVDCRPIIYEGIHSDAKDERTFLCEFCQRENPNEIALVVPTIDNFTGGCLKSVDAINAYQRKIFPVISAKETLQLIEAFERHGDAPRLIRYLRRMVRDDLDLINRRFNKLLTELLP